MRVLIACLALALASPAAAQEIFLQHRLEELRMQEEMARQRMIGQENELRALEARLKAEQAVAEIQAARAAPRLPVPLSPAPPVDVSKLPAIPDAALAASNARVRAAAQNPR